MRILFIISAFFMTSVIMGCASTPDKVVITQEKLVPLDLPQSYFTHFSPPPMTTKEEYISMQVYERENYLAKKVVESITVIGIANKRLDSIKKAYEEYLKTTGEQNAQNLKTNP